MITLGAAPDHDWLERLRHDRVIAVIRSPQLDLGLRVAEALAAGGIRQLEITWTSDRPAELIYQACQALPHCTIGAGTILTTAAAQDAIAAGAQFLFSPHTQPDLIHWAGRHRVPIVPGALSPTEIVTAWQAGATAVKVFPVAVMGGASYLRALRGPLGNIPLVPTGGVTRGNTLDLLQAGAIAVGLSTDLMPASAIAQQDWTELTARSHGLCQQVREWAKGEA